MRPCAHHLVANAALLVQPVLVLENEEAVAEIMQLKTMPIAGKGAIGSCLVPFLACCTFMPGFVHMYVRQSCLQGSHFKSARALKLMQLSDQL